MRLRDEGESYREIREQTGLGLTTIRIIIADNESMKEKFAEVFRKLEKFTTERLHEDYRKMFKSDQLYIVTKNLRL